MYRSIYAEYSPFQRSLNPFLVLLPSEMNDTRNRTPSAAILYVRLRHTSVKLAQHGSILSIYVKMHVSFITNPGPTKVNRENYWAKFLGLFGGVRPTQEFFSHLETSRLPVKSCNFLPILGDGHYNGLARVTVSVARLRTLTAQ